MTIDDTLRNRVLRLWLGGMTRDQIATKLGVSNGKISSVISSLEEKDFAIPLMRELALGCKREGIETRDLLYKFPFIQRCKKLGIHPGKTASLMARISKELELKGVTEDEVIDLFIGLSKLAVGKDLPLRHLAQEIRQSYEQLELIKEDIDYHEQVRDGAIIMKDRALQDHGVTEEQLAKFVGLCDVFEQYYNRHNTKVEEEPTSLFGERIDNTVIKRKANQDYS